MATITIDFDASPRIITVSLPDVEISIQELVNLIRIVEDDLINLDDDHLIDATGKDALPGGLATVITLRLRNARLKFADRPGPSTIECLVREGNLLAEDLTGGSISPIEPSTFTYTVIANATTGGLLSGEFNADVQKIRGDVQAAINLKESAGSMQIGTVEDLFFTPTVTQFIAGDIILFPKDEHFKSRALVFITGALAKQAVRIEDTEALSHGTKFTVSALTDPPADGDKFVVV